MIVPAHGFQAEIRAFIEHGLWDGMEQFGPASFMGWATEAEGLIAGVAFHNWHPSSGAIEISAYASRRDWLNKDRLRAAFSYVFDDLGCRIAVARIAESNTRARRFWRALGAAETLVPDLRGEGEAEAIAVLKAADWRKSKFTR